MKLFIKVFAILFAVTTVIACNSTTRDASLTDASLSDSSLTDTSSEEYTVHKHTDPDTTNLGKNSQALGPEQSFINYIVSKNTKEIILFKAALEHGSSHELKQQTLLMLREHNQIVEDVKAYITKHPDISKPVADTSNIVSINDKTGAAWDRAWADTIVYEHNELLDRLQSAKSYIGDSALNKLIINTIPVVASHLSMAKNLQARLKIN